MIFAVTNCIIACNAYSVCCTDFELDETMQRGSKASRSKRGMYMLCHQCTKVRIKLAEFLQRISIACYAKRCISYRKSVCLSDRLSDRLSHAGIKPKRLKL